MTPEKGKRVTMTYLLGYIEGMREAKRLVEKLLWEIDKRIEKAQEYQAQRFEDLRE